MDKFKKHNNNNNNKGVKGMNKFCQSWKKVLLYSVFIYGVSIFCTASTVNAKNILISFSCKDNKTPEGLRVYKDAKFINNELILGNNIKKNYSKITFKCLLNAGFISFDFGERKLIDDKTDAHWGLILYGANGQTLRYYIKKNLLYSWLRKDKKTIIHKKKKSKLSLKDTMENKFSILLAADSLKADVNGQSDITINAAILPISKIEIYAYRLSIKLKELNFQNGEKKGKVDSNQKPVFSSGFNGTSDAHGLNDKIIKPLVSKGIKFVPGIKGSAVYIGKGNASELDLSYPAKNIFANKGTVMFWVQPNWDGGRYWKSWPKYNFLSVLGDNNKKVFDLTVDTYLTASIKCINKMKNARIYRACREMFFKGDWMHIALAWDNGGWNKMYINGLPYLHGMCWRQKKTIFLTGLDLGGAKSFSLGTRAKTGVIFRNANSAIDEFKIYNRPLTEKEVFNEYSKVCPLDITIDNSVFPTNSKQIKFTIAPAGLTAIPAPYGALNKTGNIKLVIALRGKSGRKIKIWNKTVTSLKQAKQIALPVEKLRKGDYKLQVTIKNKDYSIQRTLPLVIYETPKFQAASNTKLLTGKPVIVKNFPLLPPKKILNDGGITVMKTAIGNYVESGSARGDRFGVELEFPNSMLNGKAVILEITWPDDKPRCMGFYMFRESKGPQHRDRLEGGLQTGGEFPNTGKMQKSRYLFYPGVKRYLFSARTMVPGYPAAVASIKILPLEAPLPTLKINYPKGMAYRRFGHLDEDQTFEVMLNYDDSKERNSYDRCVKIMKRLCEYLNYTGQNILEYPLLRYDFSYSPLPGSLNKLFPYFPGAVPMMIKMLKQNKIKFIGSVTLISTIELYMRPDQQKIHDKKGFLVYTASGMKIKQRAKSLKTNHTHPEVRKMFLKLFSDMARRYAKLPGVDGFDFWMGILSEAKGFGYFNNLKQGYGDYTVKLFAMETGVDVPNYSGNQRFAKRYEYLTAENSKVRSKWLAWRAGKITALIKGMREVLDYINPELKLYISLSYITPAKVANKRGSNNVDSLKAYYEEQGVDVKALQQIKNVYIMPMRASHARWYDRNWGKAGKYDGDLSMDPNIYKPFNKKNTANYSSSFFNYFETYKKSLKNKVYATYFQNVDIKPAGRYFLRDFAFNLATCDSVQMLFGGQPLGTRGREECTREFAKAYSSLPAKPFNTVPGKTDPVTVRFLKTKNGTYFYLVNNSWSDCKVKLKISRASSYLDLSSDKESGITNKTVEVGLKAYQLRSFLIKEKAASIDSFQTFIPKATKQYYKTLWAKFQKTYFHFKKLAIITKKETVLFNKLKAAFGQEDFVAFHRLYYSTDAYLMLKNAKNIDLLTQQKEMMNNNHFAVNCGSTGFAKDSTGKLFFPDQACLNEKKYGYIGNHNSVIRNVNVIKDKSFSQLFKTEAYDIDGYRFKVAPGLYDVKLFLKVGYKHSARPGVFVFNVSLAGKTVLKNFDVFKACGNDFSKTVVKEFKNVKITDGVLEIIFSTAEGRSSMVRLCNAIIVKKVN